MPPLTAAPGDDDADSDQQGVVAKVISALSDRALVVHMLITGGLGFGLSVTLSSVLYLVMTNAFFAIAFAVTLALTGLGLFVRSTLQMSPSAPFMNTVSRLGALAVCGGSALVVIEHFMLKDLGAYFHVFFFSTASTACSYAITFIATDIYNGIWRDGGQLSAKQLYTACGLSLLLGSVCGFFFAIVDVEDHVTRFGFEQWLTALIGACCGCVVGYVNHHATDEAMMFTFEPLPMEDVITPTHADDPHTDF
jgi:hypothetical protein